MNVVILHGSSRVNGVTGQLADEFARGAKDAGHHVTKVELREKTIKDCAGGTVYADHVGFLSSIYFLL